mmetsp:Transcript_8442/g.13695  ORF Transcript_8442/g.13695 Transcript_8442/m.13695 type:complete len:100 (-) Transcript_8442:433-732(-)
MCGDLGGSGGGFVPDAVPSALASIVCASVSTLVSVIAVGCTIEAFSTLASLAQRLSLSVSVLVLPFFCTLENEELNFRIRDVILLVLFSFVASPPSLCS